MEASAVKVSNRWDALSKDGGVQGGQGKKKQPKPNGRPASANGAATNVRADSVVQTLLQNGHEEEERNVSPTRIRPQNPGEKIDGAWKSTTQKRTVGVRRDKKLVDYDAALQELISQYPILYNAVQRMTLIRQWKMYIEDYDPQVKYRRLDGSIASFTELFLESDALQEIIRSTLAVPYADDTQLYLLLSHCLAGDFSFVKKFLAGLKQLFVAYKEIKGVVPDNIVDNICSVVDALKANPEKKRNHQKKIAEIDAKVSYLMGKLRGTEGQGSDDKFAKTSELLQLSVEKQRLLEEGAGGDSSRAQDVDLLLLEVEESLTSLIEFGKIERDAALERVKDFEQNKKKLIGGQDGDVAEVVAIKDKLDQEEDELRLKKRELELEIEKLNASIFEVQQKKRDHQSEYSKVMAYYQDWLNSFKGEDDNVRGAFNHAENALITRQKAREFTMELRSSVQDILTGHVSTYETQKYEATRQQLTQLETHLSVLRENVELVNRRIKFCNGRLAFMKEELQEAKDLGMDDIVKDLSQGLRKLELMQAEAEKQLAKIWTDVENVKYILDSSEGQVGLDDLRGRIRASLTHLLHIRDA